MEFKPEQIEAWKREYGADNIYFIRVEDKSCVVRKPTREVYSFVARIEDAMELSAAMLEAVWLAGDEEMKHDDDYFIPAVKKFDVLLTLKEAEIKKL